MAKDPAFLFYSSDFLVGTMTMPFDERGKYITILAFMHQNGRQTEETIRFLVGNISDSLRLKFGIDETGKWFNERLEQEIEKRSKFLESRLNNGKKGGRPKKDKPLAKPNAKPSGKPTQNLSEDVNENENIDEIEYKNVAKIKVLKSDFEITFDEFKKFRKEIKKPLTPHGEKLLLSKLEKLAPGDSDLQIAIMEQSIFRSWPGVFEIKESYRQSDFGNKPKTNRPTIEHLQELSNDIQYFSVCQ